MKFPYALLYYIVTDDLDIIEEEENLPFEVKPTDSYEDIEAKFEEYLKEHGIEVVDDELVYFDLEKSYEDHTIIFKFDDKYYGFSYTYSPYSSYDDIPNDKDLKEYEPYEVVETHYRLKK